MTRTSLKEVQCSWAQGAEVIGDKWTILILRDAMRGEDSFSGFARRIGLSKKVLSQRLDHLQEHGVMKRTQATADAGHRKYMLTEKGIALFPVIVAIGQWADSWVYGEGNEPVTVLEKATRRPIDRIGVTADGTRNLHYRDVTLQTNKDITETI